MQAAQSVVLDALTRAASQDSQVLKPAELKLKEWETQPGFYSLLFTIFHDYSVDVNVRWIAILYFKNGIDRYWRKTAPNAISDQERAALRPLMISTFDEPVAQLATQLAVLISKVARLDCPKDWPELLPTLIKAVQSNNNLEQQRALLTFYHVVKTLSAKRLPGDRRTFCELTQEIFTFICELWIFYNDQMVQTVQTSDDAYFVYAEKSTYSLKILHKLSVHGFKNPEESTDCVNFLTLLYEKLPIFLKIRKSVLNTNSIVSDRIEKYIILMTKNIANMLDHHPFMFVQFIRPSLEFTVMYVFTNTGIELLFERFVVQCFNLMKGILLCAEYRPAKIVEDTKNPLTLQAHDFKNKFFTEETLFEITRRLLSQYFLLTEEDLMNWESDPEGFAIDEGGESWKYNLRPSTEALFSSLYYQYRSSITPILLNLMNETSPACDPSDLPAILRKEAVYNAVGLAAFELHDEVDFDQWLSNTLLRELKVPSPSYKIIKRRVIVLIGQWTGVKLSVDSRPSVYESIIGLLNMDEDIVVKLAAANTLKISVDDFEFNVDQFLPYLEQSFDLLFKLLNQVVECDAKIHVLHVMSFVIERVESQIRPYAANLTQYLPLLWNESADHNMLRCAIISTLVHLVQSLGTLSAQIRPFLVAVIDYSVDITKEPHVYLLDDGLDLWWAVLGNAEQCTPDLRVLFTRMPSLLEFASDNLVTCLNIIKAHVLLDPDVFASDNSGALAQSFAYIFSDLKSEGLRNVMGTVEEIFRIIPNQGPIIFQPLLPKVLGVILQCDEYPMVMSGCLAVIGRIALQNPNIFYELLEFVASEKQQELEAVFDLFLDIFIDKLTAVTQIERRKLLGLVLASFFTNNSTVVLNKTCGILLSCVEVLNDIMNLDDNGQEIDSLILGESDNVQESDFETDHDKRKRILSMKDPIHSVVLRDFLIEKMCNLEQTLGTAAFKEVMDTVDVETKEQFMHYVKVK